MKKNLQKLFLIAALSLGWQVSQAADPTTSAPTPTAAAAKVISVFSNAYTNLPNVNFNPNWGQVTAVSNIAIGTDTLLKYTNLSYQGTEFAQTNVFAMTHLHVDVWTSDETSLQVTPISPGAEKLVALTPLNLNAWNSFEIPLSSFTGVDMTKVYQFKFVGSGGKTVILDNLYFVNKAAPDTQIPTAFTATKGAVTYNSVALVLNATDNSGAVAYDITYGTTTVSTSALSGVSKTYLVTGLESLTAYNFSVVAKDASGNATAPIVVPATTLVGFAVPTVAAPTPTQPAANVISFYSDAYTNVVGTNFAASWGQPTVLTTYMIGTNANMKYEGFTYQGIELASHVNAAAMTKLHIDVWTPNETNIRITPISPAKEFSIVLTPLNQNAWNSYDIPLSSFTGVVLSDIFQFKVDGGTGKIVYLDNLYLYNEAVVADTEKPAAFTATKGAVTTSSVELVLNATDNSGAVTYDITYGTTTLNTGSASGVSKTYTVTGLTSGTAYSFSVVAKDAAGNAATAIVVDATTASTDGPTVAAPTPSAAAAKVISVFSNAYTNLTGINFNPNWGQSTIVSNFALGTDTLLKYTNLNYQGTEFAQTNVFAMTHLHVDVWTMNETNLQVTPISPAAEKLITLTPLNLNAWNSFEIPLTSFTGVDMTKVYQFKFVGSGGKTVYLDNIYFVNNAAADTEIPTAFTATKGAVTYNSVALVLNATDNSGAVAYDITYGTTTVSTSALSGVSKTYIVTGLNSSTAYSFSVVAKDASGNVTTPVVVAATTLAGFAVPTVAAPAPTALAANVISIYSDAYTNVVGTNFAASWGQPTILTTYAIGTNNTMKYEGFTYQGIELASHVNASAMNKLHLDVWTPNETNIRITPISPAKEFSVVLTPLNLNAWNSYDIDLAAFTGVVMSDIFQFKIDGGTGKIVYLDNLYLYNSNPSALSDVTSQALNVYPNPFANTVTIAAQSNISQVTVRNLLGQIVKTQKIDGMQQTLDLSTIAAGNYLLTVKMTDGSMATRKIVKN